jgi:myo-inositol-1(or 4)-monophosphatase
MIRTALMNVMTAAALKAGRGLKRDFGEVENLQVSLKGPGDFVSAADKKAEKIVFEELSKARPGYGFRMEESGFVEGGDKAHTWHVDPLDGTTNFLHGIPYFAVSIALERDGQIVAGVVYNPVSEDMYIAERGQGAFYNNHRIRVSVRRELAHALVGCSIPHLGDAKEHPRFKRELEEVMASAGNIRNFGAMALDMAAVAAGRIDALWGRGAESWDVGAGSILVREAGGYVATIEGGDDYLTKRSLCCGNEYIQRALLALLKKTSA